MVKKIIEKDENRTFAVSASVWRTVIALASSSDLNVLGVNIPLVPDDGDSLSLLSMKHLGLLQ